MKFEPGYLFGMALQTIPEPRKIAQEIQALRFPRMVLWQVFLLFTLISTGFGVVATMMFPLNPTQYGALLSNPMLMGLTEACLLVITVFAIYWVGHAMGGVGRFDQAILTVLWLQFVMLLLQATVLALAVLSAGMAALLKIAGIAMAFWVLSHFIAEMHGFRSTGLVFVMILVTIMGAIIGLGILLAIVGVGAGAMGTVS